LHGCETLVYVKFFRCIGCGNSYSPEKIQRCPVMRCPKCNSALDAEYDYKSIQRTILMDEFMRECPNHWKYWAFMPVGDLSRIVTMGEGGTPLIDLTRLLPHAKKFFVKYEAANPTGSFKDRGSALEITKAVIWGRKRAVIASTGNMGSSVAAFAAFARLKSRIIIPEIVAQNKIIQMKAYSAEIELTSGDYAYAMKIAENQVRSDPESFLAGDYPWRCEGTKTVGFEIADQMYWRVPDAVIVPIGNGTLLWSVWKAFRELMITGITDALPRMIGVQAERCGPVVRAWEEQFNTIVPIKDPRTVASAIACGDPIDGLLALKAIRESEGVCMRVTDEEILMARDELGSNGVFVEPSGAVAFAGAKKAGDSLDQKTVVCIATGHGLKDMYGIE